MKLKTALALQLWDCARTPQGGDRQMLVADRGSKEVQAASQSAPVGSRGDWRAIKDIEDKNFNNIKVHPKCS